MRFKYLFPLILLSVMAYAGTTTYDVVRGTVFSAWNSGFTPSLDFTHEAGTRLSPTQSLSGTSIATITTRGHTNVAGAYTGVNGKLAFTALENFTSSADGTDFRVSTVPAGGTTLAEVFRASQAGIGIGAISPTQSIDATGTARFRGLTTAGPVITGATGVLASEATLAASRGGTALDTSASTGLAKVAAGTWSVATLVNADVSASAALARSKIAAGGLNTIAYNNGSGVFTDSTTFTFDGTKQVIGGSGSATALLTVNPNGGTTTLGANTAAISLRDGTQGETWLVGNNVTGSAAKTDFGILNASQSSTPYLKISSAGLSTFNGSVGFSATSTQGIVGSATNDSAATGNVGEFLTVASPTGGTATPGATGVAVNIASQSLTAGDWDCSANVQAALGGTFAGSNIDASISTTTATLDNNSRDRIYTSAVGSSYFFPVSTQRVSLSGTATVYLVGAMTYTVLGSTTWASGSRLSCRRAR